MLHASASTKDKKYSFFHAHKPKRLVLKARCAHRLRANAWAFAGAVYQLHWQTALRLMTNPVKPGFAKTCPLRRFTAAMNAAYAFVAACCQRGLCQQARNSVPISLVHCSSVMSRLNCHSRREDRRRRKRGCALPPPPLAARTPLRDCDSCRLTRHWVKNRSWIFFSVPAGC